MARTLKDFLNDINLLIDHYHLHGMYLDGETLVTPEQIKNIIDGAANAEKDSLEKIPIVKKYFDSYSDLIEYNLNDRINWQYTYPELFEEDDGGLEEENGVVHYSRYQEDIEKLEIMKRIINDLKKSPQELFGIMTPTEIMALSSMSRQIPFKFPEDINRYTGEFIGKNPKAPNGGKRKTRNKKTKKYKKRKTKRHFNKKR
jgi:hypothetical protein